MMQALYVFMNYEETIKAKLADSSKWPRYTKADHMAKLDEMADNALSISTMDERSCIASILILQQLTEELIKVLLESCQFLMQVRLLPLELTFKNSNNEMFGRVIKSLKETIDFPYKSELIAEANKINKKRIEVAHGLIHKVSLKGLNNNAMVVRNDFELFFSLYNQAQDWTRLCLKDLKQEVIGND